MLNTIIMSTIAGLFLFILQIIMKWYDQYSIMFGNIYKLRRTNKDINENTEEIRDIISASRLPIYMINNLLAMNFTNTIGSDISIYQKETKPKEQDKACSYDSIQQSLPSFKQLLFCFIIKIKDKKWSCIESQKENTLNKKDTNMKNQNTEIEDLPGVAQGFEDVLVGVIDEVGEKIFPVLMSLPQSLLQLLYKSTLLFKLIVGIISNTTLYLVLSTPSFDAWAVVAFASIVSVLVIFFISICYTNFTTAIVNCCCYITLPSFFIVFGSLFIVFVVACIAALFPVGWMGCACLVFGITYMISALRMLYLLIQTKASKLNKFLYALQKVPGSFASGIFLSAFGIFCIYYLSGFSLIIDVINQGF